MHSAIKPQPLEPVTIPTWPTCTDCLTWSDENIAVAGGEVIHILTPRYTQSNSTTSNTSTGNTDWHLTTVRVNEFHLEEWPYQDVASINYFSIGEEQSLSSVCALEWSPPGLGIHRRSVLGVLTTNLVLSIWETNGQLGMWKRGCTVNPVLISRSADGDDPALERKQARVRAFTWLSPLTSTTSTWGKILLAVADDNDTIYILSLAKSDRDILGNWNIHIVCRHELEVGAAVTNSDNDSSTLTKILTQSSPISCITTGHWERSQQNDSLTQATCSLKIEKGKIGPQTILQLKALEPLERDASNTLSSDATFSIHPQTLIPPFNPQKLLPLQSLFDKALQKPRDEFNKLHNLHGNYRVQIWGMARNPESSRAAACVTFHPRRMIEYTTPAVERALLLFERTTPAHFSNRTRLPEVEVQKNILSFVSTTSQIDRPYSEFESTIISVASRFIQLQFPDTLDPLEWSQPLHLDSDGINSSTDMNGMLEPLDATDYTQPDQHSFPPPTHTEKCEICSANINFTVPPTAASCDNGHTFTRCNLTFMAIQQPGVSKYCAECGRQFLHLIKLEPQSGPSCVRDLFEEFDVCPYCQGKFRG